MNYPAFPLYPGKYALPAVPDPSEHAAYVRLREPAATLADLDGVVLTYQQHVMHYACSRYWNRQLEGWVRGELRVLEYRSRILGICGGFGLGAPMAALVLEQLGALGATRVITVGTAASLQRELRAGEIVVCDRALRDEGVSHHYLGPAPYAMPSSDLTDHLARILRARTTEVRRGAGWSTDAPYRETAAEVAHYGAADVLTADMEAAAVFAVAEHRNIDAAAVFAVADSLVDRRARQNSPVTRNALHVALEAALVALGDTARASQRPGDEALR
ncbi:nucleoside phosphorylase [Streptomyces sparsogenes]|uniref:nucleoside phosphorylase n=1 Tax=Streptomyces sparsogenes TaxID=67365 RepID=UPI0033F1D973